MAIWAVNRPEWGLGFLAAAHAGLVAVPLDVRSTDDFATKVVEQTGPKLVLASRQTEEPARRLGLPVILIESLPDLARGAEPLPAADVSADDLLLVMFTSGTTGDPKGVMLTHGNVASNARTLVDVFPFGPNERLLSVLPLSHMFGLTCDFLAPLAAGKTVAYPVSRQPAVLVKTFRDFKITMMLIVPQGLRLLTNAIERKVDSTGKRSQFDRLHAIAPRLPRFVRRLLFRPVLAQFGGRLRNFAVGASALDPELATFWSHMGVTAVQGYGATEMSPAISFTRPDRNRIGTVGEPIPGVEVRIADDGEVLVRGPNRFVGYWQNPEATAAAIDADGWYHTGDLGELSADGFLTLRGRKKDMIALADGQKVYPDDVEAVLVGDDRIRDAAVVGLDGDGSGVRVHAVLLDGRRLGCRRGRARRERATRRPPADSRLERVAGRGLPAHAVDEGQEAPGARGARTRRRRGAGNRTRRRVTARRPRRRRPRWRRWPGSSPRWPRFHRRRSRPARAWRPISASTRWGASSC